MSKSLRDVLVSVSLANLCFLSSWLILINPSHYFYYYWKHDPGSVELVSLVALVVLLATMFWVLHRLVNSRLARLGFLLVLTWPINSYLIDYARLSLLDGALQSRWRLFGLVAIGMAALFLVWRYEKKVIAFALFILVVLSPLLLVNVTVATWLRHKHSAIPRTYEPSASLARRDGPKIIWIIFDELQIQMVFDNRPSGLSLPQFDRFSSEAINLTNAYPPSWQTLTSMPSLITGQFIKTAGPTDQNELELTTENGDIEQWSKQSSVFSEAKRRGFTTALVGWYHPYCRVIGKDLDVCYWSPQVGQTNPALEQLTFGGAVRHNIITSLLRIPLFFRVFHSVYELRQRNVHALALNEIVTDARTVLAQQPNLTLIHLPVPHSPWINSADLHPASVDGYLRNVGVANGSLDGLRRALGSNWDSSIVLLSSDHWWRDSPSTNGSRDHRIPFMLKLAGQKERVDYKGGFNTVLTRELLLQLLGGEMKNPSEVVEWIERNSRLGESSLTVDAP